MEININYPIERGGCPDLADVLRELEKLKDAVCPVVNGARESDIAAFPPHLRGAWERLRYTWYRLVYGEIEYDGGKYAVTERWYEFVPPENRPPEINCEYQSVILDEMGKEYKLCWLPDDKSWSPSILQACFEPE
jgi:hypothetical protein